MSDADWLSPKRCSTKRPLHHSYTGADARVVRDRRIAGQWLILSDEGGVAKRVPDAIRARGDVPIFVRPGTSYERSTYGRRLVIRPESPDDIIAVPKSLTGDLTGITFGAWTPPDPEKPGRQR